MQAYLSIILYSYNYSSTIVYSKALTVDVYVAKHCSFENIARQL